jgi:protein-tyrosine phosphatase
MDEEKARPLTAKVLFVCTGNICRSPTAEGVFRHLLLAENLHQQVAVDSAGTHTYHVGHPPDERSMAAAERRGYDLSGLRARKVAADDFVEFDFILAMDRDHLSILERNAPAQHRSEIAMFLDFSSLHRGDEVPDPYYGGERGFEFVLDMIEDASQGLLAAIKKKLGEQ